MPADFTGQADDLTSRVHYLYVTACESCARAKAALDALPDSVQVTRGAYAFASPVEVIAIDIGTVIGVAVLTETVFNWPGLGSRIARAVLQRDFSVVLGLSIVVTLLYAVANLVADLLYAWLDPRVRLGSKGADR